MSTKKRTTGAKGLAARSEAELVELLRPFGFPHGGGPGLGFTPEDDALFARGYPNLRLVEEGGPAKAREVEKALDAIDPVLRIRVPRAFAAAYLRGYRVGPLLFIDPLYPASHVERRAERAVAIAKDAPITVALLEGTLAEGAVGMGRDTYGRWRLPEVLHLYEHFVGSEAVARAVVDHLVRLSTDLETWGPAGDPKRTNAAGHHLALALPWILRRVPPALARELRARLAAVPRTKIAGADPQAYFDSLAAVAHPDAELPPSLAELTLPLCLAHDRAEPVAALLAAQRRHLLSSPGRLVWLLGSAFLGGPLTLSGLPLPPLVDSLAPLRDPGVVRAMAHLGAQRAGAAAVKAWLAEHGRYARPILEALAAHGDPKEAERAQKTLALSTAAAPAAPLDEDALEAEIAAIFRRLGEALARSQDREAEVLHIREAHEAYTEARAAALDPTPEAYFTHRFGDFGLGKWAMLAVEAID